jgi:hypothetical protein
VTLVVLSSLLAPIAVDAIWIRNTALDTDHFVAELGPMIDDPAVQSEIVNVITTNLTDRADIGGRLDELLPQQLGFLRSPIEAEIVGLVRSTTRRVVESDRFAELFRRSLTTSHALVVDTLTGRGDRLRVDDDRLILDLSEVRGRVVERVNESSLGRFIELDTSRPAEIVLLRSDAVTRTQGFVRLLQRLAFWLPLVALALAAAAVGVSRDRRRGVMWVSIGIVISMSTHLILLAIGRDVYLRLVTKTLDPDASGVVYDLLVNFPRTGSRALLLLAFLLAVGASLAGPSPSAVRFRALVTSVGDRASASAAQLGAFEPVTRFARSHRRGLSGLVLACGALVLVLVERIRVPTVLWTAFGVCLALASIAVLAAAAPPQETGVSATSAE